MRRWVYAYRVVDRPPAVLEDLLQREDGDLLRTKSSAPRGRTSVDGSVLLDVPTTLAGVPLAKQVRASTGVAFRTGRHLRLPLRWHAEPAEALFPTFEGTLEVERLADDRAQVTLAGSYRVPLGPLGAVVDVAGLRHAATTTVETLVDAVADRLSDLAGRKRAAEHVAGPRRGRPLRVRDVMTPDPIVIDPDVPLRTAALLLYHAEVSGAPVVDATGELVGVISQRDLLMKEARWRRGHGRPARVDRQHAEAVTVAQACSAPARVTVPDALLSDAARELVEHDVSRLVVVEHGAVAGILTRHDVLAALVRGDADIAYAVDGILSMYDEGAVRARVVWGEVTLTGSTELRSTAGFLLQSVAGVDGVMTVHDEVTWAYDDLAREAQLPIP